MLEIFIKLYIFLLILLNFISTEILQKKKIKKFNKTVVLSIFKFIKTFHINVLSYTLELTFVVVFFYFYFNTIFYAI